MDTFNQLSYMGFGLHELTRLYTFLIEIAIANNIKVLEIVSKFLDDIEKQYDNKLGFESVINKLKVEKENLENEVPQYKWYLQLQGIVSPILIHLNYNGVSNEDIININNLVLSFKNSNFIQDTPINQSQNNNNINRENRNSSSSGTSSTGSISNNEYWKIFIEKLKSLKNINLEITRQTTISNNLKNQINTLKTKKQQLEKTYLESTNNLNYIILQTSNLIKLASQFNQQYINQKITMVTPHFSPVFVNMVSTKDGIENDDSNDNEKKKDDV